MQRSTRVGAVSAGGTIPADGGTTDQCPSPIIGLFQSDQGFGQ